MSFVRFFQVVFLLQLFGFSQLHAHTGKSSHAFFSPVHYSQLVTETGSETNHKIITSFETHNFHQLMLEEVENVEESGDELNASSENQDIVKHLSAFSFYQTISEDPFHASYTGFAFRRQLSTVLINRRYIIFEVFRI